MDMVTEIYKLTDSFPKRKFTALQIRFAARPFQFPATSLKGRRITVIANPAIS